MNYIYELDMLRQKVQSIEAGSKWEGLNIVNRLLIYADYLFKNNSRHVKNIEDILNDLKNDSIQNWEIICTRVLGSIDDMLLEINLEGDRVKSSEDSEISFTPYNIQKTNEVFIVHGHDSEMIEAIENLLIKLEVPSIILRNEADKGRNILEKLIKESRRSGYAIVLLSPDDIGYKHGYESSKKFRARQNVILELGFFISKLGKHRVTALYKEEGNKQGIELPSDFAGTLYKKYESHSMQWKHEIARELEEAGYDIDLNKLKK